MDPEFYNSRYRVHTSIQLQRSNEFDIYEVNAESTLAATTEWTRRFLQPTRLVQAFLLLGVLVFAALNLSYVPLLSSIELQAAEVHDLVWRKKSPIRTPLDSTGSTLQLQTAACAMQAHNRCGLERERISKIYFYVE
jgi:hypothetical protein